MNCPVDGSQLVMSDRAGVEIDYCPQCRGVWLDRGELDKIIERDAQRAAPRYEDRGYRDDDRDRDRGRGDRAYGERRRSRGSFLGDLFGD